MKVQPTLANEEALWRQGKIHVAGIDEAGRGPLAGPVVAAAVVFGPGSEMIDQVRDSKQLSAKMRERLYDEIRGKAAAVGLGIVGPEEIDRINILQATYKAMRQAVGRLGVKAEHLLVDGRPMPDKLYPQTAIVGGDQSCYSIAAASIIAKVFRDRLMLEYAQVLPGYGFEKHKGYGTRVHLEALQKLKASPIHRYSFQPVRENLPNYDRIENRRDLGRMGEDQVACYLHNKGYKILERNFHLGAYGELDIIVLKDDQLSFVEVKTQRRKVFGEPETWVDERKSQQLAMIAEGYLARHPELDVNCHFDVAGVKIEGDRIRIKYIRDAFRP